jgi:C1A family cysteine protease
MQGAFSYSNGNPLQPENTYGYVAQRQGCRYNRGQGVVAAQYVHNVPQQDVNQLRAAVNQGPVSVAIQANEPAFQGYRGGIISGGCGSQLDHGVLVVGYGDNYWVVKNSWGPGWGEGGYVRIAQSGGAGVCGINLAALYPDTN